jgi:hypothetical protein
MAAIFALSEFGPDTSTSSRWPGGSQVTSLARMTASRNRQ